MRRDTGVQETNVQRLTGWVWGGLAMVAVSVLAACGGPSGSESEGPTGVQVGDRAAGFTVTTPAGESIALDDYRGSVILLNFWATWCGPCREEMPAFQAAYEARKDDGLVVLAVNYQQKAADVTPFVEELGLTFPVALDPSLKVATLYRVRGLPMSLVIDREGLVRVRHVGHISQDLLNQVLQDHLP
jgi:cytochrome c biogenesis protein CcmG/thiol:disulfide interchange protein DsbE